MHFSVRDLKLKKGIVCLSLAADSYCSPTCSDSVALGHCGSASLSEKKEGRTCIALKKQFHGTCLCSALSFLLQCTRGVSVLPASVPSLVQRAQPTSLCSLENQSCLLPFFRMNLVKGFVVFSYRSGPL